MNDFGACIFDLDGVIVDTAKYHFIAWRHIARELGFEFTERDNERLKGVSRQRSLDILLSVGRIACDDARKAFLAEKKNGLYLQYIRKMTPEEILPGAEAFLAECRSAGVKTGLATASRNSQIILDRLSIAPLFDAVVDGNKVVHTKPHPEAFLTCAAAIGTQPARCVVFEDAEAGIEAALAAGMFAVGVGDQTILAKAQLVVPGLASISLAGLRATLHRTTRPVAHP
jgi:beta-phosphoglucomutase